MNTAGQRIKQRREELGYTHQGEFARLVGCAQSTLSEIESGETKLPSAKVMAKMCEVLGKTDRWILYGEDGETSLPTKDESDLLSAFRGMTDEAKVGLLSIINSLPRK
jgi:transcriptional regulator with XRE-family HTH domain